MLNIDGSFHTRRTWINTVTSRVAWRNTTEHDHLLITWRVLIYSIVPKYKASLWSWTTSEQHSTRSWNVSISSNISQVLTNESYNIMKDPATIGSPQESPVLKKRRISRRVPIDMALQVQIASVQPRDREALKKRLRKQITCCEINEITTSGLTALNQCVLDGNFESVKMLVELGADVNKKDRFGWTALHYAASEGYEEICRFLLRNGANLRAEDKDGKFPVEVTDDELILRILLRATLMYNMPPLDRESLQKSCWNFKTKQLLWWLERIGKRDREFLSDPLRLEVTRIVEEGWANATAKQTSANDWASLRKRLKFELTIGSHTNQVKNFTNIYLFGHPDIEAIAYFSLCK